MYHPAFAIEAVYGGKGLDVLTGTFEPEDGTVIELRVLVRSNGEVLSIGATEPYILDADDRV